MAFAERRGGFWRARWTGLDGKLESKPGFLGEKAAVQYGRDQEAAIRAGTYSDPRAGKTRLIQWVNLWFPAQDLEPTTLENYRYAIEAHILPEFGERALEEITAEEVAKWEMGIMARGFARRTARDARTVLTVIYGDAIPRYVKVNPAQRKRGKGRKGQRRIARIEHAEKVWPTPMQALLIAERCATLTGRDEDFLLVITLAYTGMRWSEVLRMSPDYVNTDMIDIQWKLQEFKGRFYIGRPKDGSIRAADLPPFLAELLAEHIAAAKTRKCTCRKRDGNGGAGPGTTWCTGAAYVFLSSGGRHYHRSDYAADYFHPAADGWYPELASHRSRPARPVMIDPAAPFPGRPLQAWPAAIPSEPFAPPTGRGVQRYLSDLTSGRCAVCGRTFSRRLDGLVVAHKGDSGRCPGSGLLPAEDLALASWLPVSKGLTPHGFRHGHKVWMDEDQIADVLKSDRLGHDEPGMRGVYGHVSPTMREQLKAALQVRWEQSLRQRAALSPISAVSVLNRLLADVRPVQKPIRLTARTGYREKRLRRPPASPGRSARSAD